MTIAISAISYLLVLLCFLPLVRDQYWLFRALEYPRFQKFILVLALLAIWVPVCLFYEADYVAISLLGISAVYLFIKIYPYTPLYKKEVATVADKKDDSIKVFTANVLQDNFNYQGMLSEIRKTDPDVIMLVETDQGWENGMKPLRAEYPFVTEEPRDNTYGMLFFSRLEVESSTIRHIVKNDVPSLEAVVRLRSGQQVQLYGLHPEPPVPGESMRSTAKDKELMKVAFRVRENKLPCIVMGDLNDVAWSYTTSLFTKVSRLLDVRCGRGFYSTFSAKSHIMRFPLDYIFCSPVFGLHTMKRLPANGSDHFPIFTHLVYREDLRQAQEKADKADKGDKHEAADLASR